MSGKTKDLTGLKFGRLLALKPAEYIAKNGIRKKGYLCLCDCGNEKVVSVDSLSSGKTKSCGCLIKDFNSMRAKYYYKITGLDDEQRRRDARRISEIHKNMRQRCYNPKSKNYMHYGGRGIKICDEWLNEKSSFIAWSLENGYREGLTIDRIDVNGDYTPSNCRWVNKTVQANNMRTNTHIYYNGKRYTLAELSRITGVERHILSAIARNGLDLYDNAERRKMEKCTERQPG